METLEIGNPTDRPDRLHFHQLTMRYLEIRFLGRESRHLANPVATLVLLPLISMPQILGVLFWNDFSSTVWHTFFAGLIFVITYFTVIKMAKKTRSIS